MKKILSLLSLILCTSCNGVKTYKVPKIQFPLENVEIKKEHFIDKGEKDKDGYYYYEYYIYNFCLKGLCYSVRSYTDEPEEASFFSNDQTLLTKKDFSNPLFIHAYYYLIEKENKTKFTYLKGSGYKSFKLIH